MNQFCDAMLGTLHVQSLSQAFYTATLYLESAGHLCDIDRPIKSYLHKWKKRKKQFLFNLNIEDSSKICTC